MFVDEMEDDEKELEHSSIQEKLDKELKELDKKLEQKEVKFSCLAKPFSKFVNYTNIWSVLPFWKLYYEATFSI